MDCVKGPQYSFSQDGLRPPMLVCRRKRKHHFDTKYLNSTGSRANKKIQSYRKALIALLGKPLDIK